MHTSLSPSRSLCLSMFVCETSTCGTPYTLKYHSQMPTLWAILVSTVLVLRDLKTVLSCTFRAPSRCSNRAYDY